MQIVEQIRDVEQLFPRLRERFRETVVERVIFFEAMKARIDAGQSPVSALLDIANLAHKITGVAATLGFSRSGEYAAALERRIRAGLESGAPIAAIWRDVLPILDCLLDELESLLDT